MTLLEQWRRKAYDTSADRNQLQALWDAYFAEEKAIYAQLLKTPDETVSGTVKELADKFNISIMSMVAFLDGINDLAAAFSNGEHLLDLDTADGGVHIVHIVV